MDRSLITTMVGAMPKQITTFIDVHGDPDLLFEAVTSVSGQPIETFATPARAA